MSAFAREEEDAGGDDSNLVEEHVDESQLKLPSQKWDLSKTTALRTLEEDEEQLYKE
jgi:hypothetical protein